MDFAIKFAFDIAAFISVMVLIVLGLGVIASMMGIFNFAHGEFVLLGAYTVYLFSDAAGLGAWPGLVAAPFVLGAGRAGAGTTIIRRFYQTPIIAMLGTYAIGLVIREIVRGLLGGHYKSIPEPISRRVHVSAASNSRGGAASSSLTTLVVIAGSTWLSWRAPRSACGCAARWRTRCWRAPAASRPAGSMR